MPRIVIQADKSESDSAGVTLSERIIPDQLRDPHYAAQLFERLSWAAADAESLEALSSHPRLQETGTGAR
jgi:hypothetical protein